MSYYIHCQRSVSEKLDQIEGLFDMEFLFDFFEANGIQQGKFELEIRRSDGALLTESDHSRIKRASAGLQEKVAAYNAETLETAMSRIHPEEDPETEEKPEPEFDFDQKPDPD